MKRRRRGRSRGRGILALLTALLAAVAVLGSCGGDPGEPDLVERAVPPLEPNPTVITVDPADRRGEVSPMLYGANHRYAYDGFGMYDPEAEAAYPEFTEAVERAGLSALRFPGGTIANTYHWKEAIGPVEERGRNAHGGTGEPLTNEYGPDEHARFAEEAGAATNLVVNFGSGDAAEAADWVEYMNAPVGANPNGGTDWAAERAANGHPEPYGVTYWEVGNELQRREQRYWLGTGSASEIASKYAFGGTTMFFDLAVKQDDRRAEAAESAGTGSQTFYAKYPPVRPGSETVFVGGEAWSSVTDLEGAGPEDVYQLDPETGAISFGDGENGNVPPEGADVSLSYDSGPHDGFVSFYEAMKSVDPSIKVCSGLESEEFLRAMGSEYPYDCLAMHPYSGPVAEPDKAHPYESLTPEEVHDRVMLLPEEKGNEVAGLRDEIRRYADPQAEEVEILISEYGLFFGSTRYTGPASRYLLSLDQALYVAQSLQQWTRLGIPLANKHSLVDFDPTEAPAGSRRLGPVDQAILGPNPGFVPSATALVFELFTTSTGTEVAASGVANNPEREVPGGDPLAALQTTATTDQEGNVYLIVVNRDRETSVAAMVELPDHEHDDRAAVQTLTAPDYLSYNTPEDPNAVSIMEEELSAGPAAFNHTFPAHSVTAIRLSGVEPA